MSPGLVQDAVANPPGDHVGARCLVVRGLAHLVIELRQILV